jgi:Leucine-rich repeat (LRR) protein
MFIWCYSLSDISPLKNLTQMFNLALNTNNIQDVSAISWMKELKFLYLWENNISDISSLENLGKLDELFIWKNKIKFDEYPRLNSIRSVWYDR